MQKRRILTVNFGDTHSGSSTALFPNYKMYFKYDDNNIFAYEPTLRQSLMYDHFLFCADYIRANSAGAQIVFVMNGDAIDGNHHGTVQVVSANPKHHSEIFIELMDTFLDRSGFSVKNGDELYFVSGTESHTGWEEYGISNHYQHMGATYHDELRLTLNERRAWWTHQGARPGKGVKEGNPIRNFAADLYWDCIKENVLPPHLLFSSHFHKSAYDSFNDSYKHTIHYQTLASWQYKTRFGLRAAPYQRNDIGLTVTEISENGDVRINAPLLMKESK